MRLSKHLLLIPLLIIVLGWGWYLYKQPAHAPNFSDFEVYYVAGQKTLAHQTVYDTTGLYRFRYAPSVALMFGLTISQPPRHIIQRIFYWGSLLAWLAWGSVVAYGSILAVRRELITEQWPVAWSKLWADGLAILWLMGLMGLFYGMGLRDELKLGQINIVMLWFLLIGVLLLQPHHWLADIGGGVALAIATLIKPYWGLFVIVLLFKRRWWGLLGVILAGVLLNGVMLAIYHGIGFTISENMAWLMEMANSSYEHLLLVYNVSLLGMVTKWGGSLMMAQLVSAIGLLATLIGLYILRHRPIYDHFMLITAIIPVITPLAWPYWMLFTLPAFFYLAYQLHHRLWFALPLGGVYLYLTNVQNDAVGHFGATFGGNILVIALFLGVLLTDKFVVDEKSKH